MRRPRRTASASALPASRGSTCSLVSVSSTASSNGGSARRGGQGASAAPMVQARAQLTPRTNAATGSSAGCISSSSGVPTCSTRPSCRIASRWPRRSASSRSCVTKTIVRPVSACSANTSVCRPARISGSSAEKASSITMMSVSAYSAQR
jgi:hypothetical protein